MKQAWDTDTISSLRPPLFLLLLLCLATECGRLQPDDVLSDYTVGPHARPARYRV